MNKLAIPAILVGTVMIAGIFAFMPVEKASTVHQEIIDAINGDLAGAKITRIVTAINNAENNGGTTWSQVVTYDRINSSGAFQIEKLYLCDLNNSSGFIDIGFDLETGLRGDDGKDPGQPSFVSAQGNPVQTGIGFNSINGCMDLKIVQYNRGGTESQEVGPILLGGDHNNNVNVRFQDSDCGGSTDTAFLVAYIVGLDSSDEMSTSPQTNFDQC